MSRFEAAAVVIVRMEQGPGGWSGYGEAAVILRVEAAPGPSFNGSFLKRGRAEERF
jgi:hypothetical protein